MIIAIDGPAGAGKSSVAKDVAKKIGFQYLDTGAMFRAITVECFQNDIDVNDEPAVSVVAKNCTIKMQSNPNKTGETEVFINGKNVTSELRTDRTTEGVTPVCKYKVVRDELLRFQREIGNSGNFVVDGRDIGSVVFPDAVLKIYLDADPEERAKRRYKQDLARGKKSNYDKVLAELNKRDFEDSHRKIAPLRCVEDAFVINSTELTQQQVCNLIVERAKELNIHA